MSQFVFTCIHTVSKHSVHQIYINKVLTGHNARPHTTSICRYNTAMVIVFNYRSILVHHTMVSSMYNHTCHRGYTPGPGSGSGLVPGSGSGLLVG